MREKIVFFVLLATLIVAGCAQYEDQPEPETDMTTPEDTGEHAEEEDEEGEEIDNTENATEESPDSASTEHEVLIEGFEFKPAALQISAGDTVTWINMDSAPHTATSDDESFDSGSLSKGESFSFTFEEEGNFNYICTFHPSMKGEIIVEA